MMPKQIPSIAGDKATQDDARLYATEHMKNLRVDSIQSTIEHAYMQGAIRAFGIGYRVAYFEKDKDWEDTVKYYKLLLDQWAAESYANALQRGKITPLNTHEDIVAGITDEIREFQEATDAPSEHLPHYTQRQEELADILICCLTELHREKVGITNLITAKIEFNKTR